MPRSGSVVPSLAPARGAERAETARQLGPRRVTKNCLGIFVWLALVAPGSSSAQDFDDLRNGQPPLVLSSVGSFYVGGRVEHQTSASLGSERAGPIFVDQMYVQYMIPQGSGKPSVVMIHGATLSGKSYETTPDGRMGWYEYFVRKGFPSYVVDQVGRARSGFNQAPFNEVRAGASLPNTQPNLRRMPMNLAWVRFRAGQTMGDSFDGSQVPIESADSFAKQAVPDLGRSLPADNPNYAALVELAGKLRRTILMGHSQSGRYPFETALLNPYGLEALVAIEPQGCNASGYSPDQFARLARLPILIIFGDHLDAPQAVGPSWIAAYKDCEAFVDRVNKLHGNAKLLHLPAFGISGNSHMIMQDKNNLQVADLILDWILGIYDGKVVK